MCWRKQDFIVSQLRNFGFTHADWWPISRKNCRASVSQTCRSVQIIYLNHEDLRGRQAEGSLAKETWLSMKVQIHQTNKKNDFSPLLFPLGEAELGRKLYNRGSTLLYRKREPKMGITYIWPLTTVPTSCQWRRCLAPESPSRGRPWSKTQMKKSSCTCQLYFMRFGDCQTSQVFL